MWTSQIAYVYKSNLATLYGIGWILNVFEC